MDKQLKKDIYFLRICDIVASESKCFSRHCGAVIVRDNNIISTGYNGPPKGVLHCNERKQSFFRKLDNQQDTIDYCTCAHGALSSGPNCITCKKIVDRQLYNNGKSTCPRKYFNYKSGQGLHMCSAGHAERNAIVQAAKNGITTNQATIYVNTGWPCKECIIAIINAGIQNIVIWADTQPYDQYGPILLQEANIPIRTVPLKLIKENSHE